MGASSNWLFNVVRRKFAKKPPPRDIIIFCETKATQEEESANLLCTSSDTAVSLPRNRVLTEEDVAATKIQAHFRGHLARRAFRALRSLVKLQAMVRGARVRKQARMALHCMHAMVRLQVSVRARQLLR